VSKDRLYTLAAGSPERRSAQTAMFIMADGLARLLARFCRHRGRIVAPSSLRRRRFRWQARRARVECTSRCSRRIRRRSWTPVSTTVDAAARHPGRSHRALEGARQDKTIGTSLQAHVRITAGGDSGSLLSTYEADLPMLFIVSQVTLATAASPDVAVSVTRADGHKCERCWRTVTDIAGDGRLAGLCSRCVDALGRTATGRSRDSSGRRPRYRRSSCRSGPPLMRTTELVAIATIVVLESGDEQDRQGHAPAVFQARGHSETCSTSRTSRTPARRSAS
jgi:isoleucyl-tRNA synthetase